MAESFFCCLLAGRQQRRPGPGLSLLLSLNSFGPFLGVSVLVFRSVRSSNLHSIENSMKSFLRMLPALSSRGFTSSTFSSTWEEIFQGVRVRRVPSPCRSCISLSWSPDWWTRSEICPTPSNTLFYSFFVYLEGSLDGEHSHSITECRDSWGPTWNISWSLWVHLWFLLFLITLKAIAASEFHRSEKLSQSISAESVEDQIVFTEKIQWKYLSKYNGLICDTEMFD